MVPGRAAVVMLRPLSRPTACRIALIRLLLPAFCAQPAQHLLQQVPSELMGSTHVTELHNWQPIPLGSRCRCTAAVSTSTAVPAEEGRTHSQLLL